MEFFIYCTYNDLFFCGKGELNFSCRFMDAMFFTGVGYALFELNEYLETQEELTIDDFVLYQKGDIC